MKAMLIYSAFLCGGLVITLTPLAWRTFGGHPVGGGKGFDEPLAFVLAFGVVFAIAASLGFVGYLLIRRSLVGVALPERALLLSLLSSIPPFILFQFGVVETMAHLVASMSVPFPIALIMLPIFALLSALSAALIFGLAGRREHFPRNENG